MDTKLTPPVWASLITNISYLPGLLTLHHSLLASKTLYPLIALITDALPAEAQTALRARGIAILTVPHLLPSHAHEYADARFLDTWTKLAAFGLTQFERVVLLDGDMLVRRNMDELMEVELDVPPDQGSGNGEDGKRVFAACPACTCNPAHKPNYPPSWTPANCAYTYHHTSPLSASTHAPPAGPLAAVNSGLLLIRPSTHYYNQILTRLEAPDTATMEFPDQDLLADLFKGRWVVLPYVYNALKTLRWKGVHDAFWKDDEVKNVHYILSPKPWNEVDEKGVWTGMEESHTWWVEANKERKREDKVKGLTDGF